MTYKHTTIGGTTIDLPVGKVICVARNYYAHIRELNNPVPSEPIFFIKPSTALAPIENPIVMPEYSDDCHHETELAVLFDKTLARAERGDEEDTIFGYGIGLDLTLRDVQRRLKDGGYPWEIAKGFDGSCPMSGFVGKQAILNPQDVRLQLSVNNEVRQDESTKLMITGVFDLILAATRYFTIQPGDILMTGTPAGVARLTSGDILELMLDEKYKFSTSVV